MIYRPGKRSVKLQGLKISRIDKKFSTTRLNLFEESCAVGVCEAAGEVKCIRRALPPFPHFTSPLRFTLSAQSNRESLSSLSSWLKSTGAAVTSDHSTDSRSCWWNPHIIKFQKSGRTEIKGRNRFSTASKHVPTRWIWMLQEWTPPSPTPPPPTKCCNSHLGCLFASVENNGCGSRWNIASAANPYGSGKLLAKSKLHFYRHIWRRISILIASWCVYTQQGLIPGRSWLTWVTQPVWGFCFLG